MWSWNTQWLYSYTEMLTPNCFPICKRVVFFSLIDHVYFFNMKIVKMKKLKIEYVKNILKMFSTWQIKSANIIGAIVIDLSVDKHCSLVIHTLVISCFLYEK